ncbi:hypothetical protein B0H13DRAFT_1972065 [Mycena leptocephala]|nr:hypothetical protein B0H13DRAFT_1972065 [Mycena leptocephala]
MPSYYELHGLQAPTVPKAGCRRVLKLKKSKSGVNAGSDYIKCYNPNHEDLVPAFWYFFPRESLSASSDLLPPAIPPPAQQPPPALGCKCLHPGCQLSGPRISQKCRSQMCKLHYESSGGCTLQIPLPPPTALPSLSSYDLEILATIKSYADQAPRSAEYTRQQHLLKQRQQSAALPFVPSPSPTPSPTRIFAQAAERSFPPVHWPLANQPAVISGIQGPASWPYWTFSTKQLYECFSVDYNTWMLVPANYVHRVASGRPLLIRNLGVTGSNEQEQVRRLRAFVDPPYEPLVTRLHPRKRTFSNIIDVDSDDARRSGPGGLT